ncbi:MAG TPA: glycine zipper 2TM domain-containing protein [Longimicrobiales bacterium]|nr:glycine zipper 2TM domain-containing protein [Longimicrobiales bacterium]
MAIRKLRAAWLLAMPLAMMTAACNGDAADDRTALRDDELARELDLALQSDAEPVTFQDTTIALEEPAAEPQAEPEPDPPAPAPRVTPRRPERTPTPAPQPAPRREAPTQAPAPQPRVVTSTVPMGTSMSLTLNQTLSTETNRVGDSFTATLQSAVRDGSGNVLIPAGATVRGRLTGVNKSGHVGETGMLKLAFEAVSFGGRSYAMDGTVVRANPQRSNRTSAGEQVGKAAAGAAAGAILGRVIGKDTKSTLKGAIIGAAAGTAIAMGTADVDVVLPAGSAMDIRLDSPIEIRRTVS